MRRSTFVGEPVTYGAIGGTLAPDLLAYPPAGYRADEHAVRLGSGAERFAIASSSLMTWGVQRGSGIEVHRRALRAPATQYTGLVFDADGTPVGRAARAAGRGALRPRRLPVHHRRDDRDAEAAPVAARRSPRRCASSTSSTSPAASASPTAPCPAIPRAARRPSSSSTATTTRSGSSIRSFSRPSTAFYRLAAPVLRSAQKRYTKRYLRALHPVAAAV